MRRPITRGQLLRTLDQPRVEQAIERAERATSGEIRVSIAPFFWGSVQRNAERAFHRLGMQRTRERNGVLLFVVPARRRLAIIGDEGIHARVGQRFWEELLDDIRRRFRQGDFTQGLVSAVDRVGEQLAQHFPCKSDDEDELPNKIDF